MNIVIDFESDVPIYIQLKNQIIKGIAKKEIENGYSLPSVRALADDIGINMHTVNKAYGILKSEGYIILDRRHGAFISVTEKTNEEESKFKDDLSVIIHSCIAKNMKKEEITSMLNEIYSDIKGGL